MTRTWYSLPGGEPFAVAGLWRATDEWGDAYTMVMVESSGLQSNLLSRVRDANLPYHAFAQRHQRAAA